MIIEVGQVAVVTGAAQGLGRALAAGLIDRGVLMRGIATVMEPEVAAERILAAVEADQLYALTHGDFDDRIRHRVEGILAALDGHGKSGDHVATAGDK